MNRQPRGIRAERSYSHVQLESAALGFRKAVGFAENEPIDGLKFYDQIQDYSVVLNGKTYPIFCRVDRLVDGAEAQAVFDPGESAYEIVLSEQTYEWLDDAHRVRARAPGSGHREVAGRAAQAPGQGTGCRALRHRRRTTRPPAWRRPRPPQVPGGRPGRPVRAARSSCGTARG